MICKRINNDFDALVEVLHEGVKIDLSLYEITSVRMVSNQAYKVTDYEVRNGSLFLHVTPLIVPRVGRYRVVVTYRMADPTLADGFWNFEFDKYLVTIVGTSEEEDAGDVVITADAVIGMRGKSAYQVWLDAGNIGTVEDYLADIKGDPFTYDDLTPEQIAELQQPATDAIASIQEVELAVETAEGLRQQAEINRQSDTATAIFNAEQATDDANDAAILANEKAGLANNAALLADEKAGLAATATTQANAARDGANSAAQSATNLVNSYAEDLAAKELKANKQNSLAVDGTGTKFPTVDAVNEGLAGVSNNLIASYEYNLNTEIYVSEIDIVSGVFTSVGHSLVDGDIIYPTLNLNVGAIIALAQYPGGMTQTGYYVVSATANTFALSLTAGGAIITYTGAGDFTKYHFEYKSQRTTLITIDLVNSYRKLKIDYYGKSLVEGSTSHITFNSSDYAIGTSRPIWNTQNGATTAITHNVLPACTISSYALIELDTSLSTEILPHAILTLYSKSHGSNTISANKITSTEYAKYISNHAYAFTYKDVRYVRLQMQGYFANGTRIIIYKL